MNKKNSKFKIQSSKLKKQEPGQEKKEY